MLADLGLFYCALFWGVSFPVMKILVGVYPTCWLLFLRFLAGALMIYVVFHKRINKSFRNDFKGGVIIGVLLFLAATTQTLGLNYIDSGRNAFITSVYVILVPLFLWVIKRKFPGWFTLAAAVICVIGMYLLSGENLGGGVNIGDFLTFLCAIFFAVQIIAISHYTQGSDPITLSCVEFFTLAALSFISSLLFETRTEIINIPTLWGLLFMIFFCTFGCYAIQICAQKYAEPSHATIIMSLESVFGLASGIIFLGEKISFKAGVGCALIFIAVLISELAPLIHKKK
ncbi:MAG: DMT family transporter [Synergistaceae bacterium]|nr:DMT family transporter [Synergistaceae bacterium]